MVRRHLPEQVLQGPGSGHEVAGRLVHRLVPQARYAARRQARGGRACGTSRTRRPMKGMSAMPVDSQELEAPPARCSRPRRRSATSCRSTGGRWTSATCAPSPRCSRRTARWAGASGEATGPEGIYTMLTASLPDNPPLAGRDAVAPDHRSGDHGRRRPRDGGEPVDARPPRRGRHAAAAHARPLRGRARSSRTGAGASCGARSRG